MSAWGTASAQSCGVSLYGSARSSAAMRRLHVGNDTGAICTGGHGRDFPVWRCSVARLSGSMGTVRHRPYRSATRNRVRRVYANALSL